MSRTARALIAGLAAAGVLVVGAGAAFADDNESDRSSSSSSSESADSTDSEDGGSSSSSEDSEEPQELPAPSSGAADPLSGLLGSLPLGL